jgi:cell fate (sporulation/competence/biofilm development) regulator YmcA (YheA/YmcA/DUF963 family)
MNPISKTIDSLSDAFFELPLVRDYFKVIDLINADKNLLALSDEVKHLQKKMTLSMGRPNEHERYKSDYEAKLNAYNSHPYIVNYTYLKNEVEDLLTQMKTIIELP